MEGGINKMFNDNRINEYKSKRIVVEIPPEDELAKLAKSILDENGFEHSNPIPDVIPTDERSTLSLQQQVLRIMNHHLIKREMTVQGFETEEEANDFDVGEYTEESIYQTMDDESPVIIDNKTDVVPEGDQEVQPPENSVEAPPESPEN